ncbi:MAG TPA: dicarboxylate/amino acid:cation symporter [Verrucomicrobiae bacterium]|nr:dicarboxylate/amino acid:cation symporter [Verrucomicrobiae bacterium]
MKRIPQHLQILGAIALGVGFGAVIDPDASIGDLKVVSILQVVGDLFLNLLKMLVVPLVVATIISGVASLGPGRDFGRIGTKALIYFVSTTFIAVLIGLMFVNFVRPGTRGDGVAPLAMTEEARTQLAKVEGTGAGTVMNVLMRFVPQNVIRSAADGDMLGLIFFSIVFGYFAGRLTGERHRLVLGFFQGIHEVMLLVTNWVMLFAPLGVFALVAKVVATTGLDVFRTVALFFVTVVAGLALHLFVFLPLLVRLIGRVNPVRHFRAMMPALVTAFSTASSSATLPLTLKCIEQRAGVSSRTSGIVVPLGATVNMDGTALYECVAVLFIAQVYGVELSLGAQFTVVLLALLTSIGVAGIPAASLVAIVIIMNAVGVPAEGLGLILAVDRILDMCRTAVNVFSDSCGAVIIARTEGEQQVLAA